jgi:predicted PurR-regulated permease PerM
MKTANMKTYFKIALVAFVFYLAIYYWEGISGFIGSFFASLIPLIAGFSVAYVLNILMSFYEKYYFPKYSHKPIVKKTKTYVCAIASLVSTGPGEIQTHLIPYFDPNCAMDFVRPYISPAFEVG